MSQPPVRDAAFRPLIPVGHTQYTWGKSKQATTTASSPSIDTAASASASKPTTSSSSSGSSSSSLPISPLPTSSIPLGDRTPGRSTSSSSPILPVSDGRRNILITSALPYVNNVPHLGNIIGCVLSADVYARFCRLRGHNAIYICGTDEYGTATETKAMEAGVTPQQICDKYYAIHRDIYEWFNISFDYFGRTTTTQQTIIAQDIFNKLDNNSYLLTKDQQQLFCETCKRYLADRFVEGECPTCHYSDARGDQCDSCGLLINAVELIKPRCKTCSSTPVERTSTHLFLDLSRLQSSDLQPWIERQQVQGAWSDNAIATTRSWLEKGLEPRCITRDLKWGTPVPKEGFTDKVFYVWFDAPIGYISITANYTPEWEKWWKNPTQVQLYQFMGKDNTPFHTVIFPSSLLASRDNYTLLHHINTTEYLNYETTKFSKSRGTGVFGDDVKSLDIDPAVWRYYLLANRPEQADTTFLWEDFALKNNTELLNNLGNFLQRTLAFIKDKLAGVVPGSSGLTAEDVQFVKEISGLKKEYVELLEAVKIKDGLKVAMGISRRSNQFLQDHKPWDLLKAKNSDRCNTIIAIAANLIYLLALLLEPYLPSLTSQISKQLNFSINPGDLSSDEGQFTFSIPAGHRIGTPSPIFHRIEDTHVQQYRAKFGGQVQSKSGVEFPLDLIVGKVVKVEDHKTASHLYVLTVDVGQEQKTAVPAASASAPAPASASASESSSPSSSSSSPSSSRQIVSGIKDHYKPSDLLHRYVILLNNIQFANLKGVVSEGMLLTAMKNKPDILTLPIGVNVTVGSRAVPVGAKLAVKANFDVRNELKKLVLETGEGGVVFFGDCALQVEGQNVIAESKVQGAKIQ